MLTLQQAFNNLKVATEKFVGTKPEHLAMEQSLLMIQDILFPKETISQDVEDKQTIEDLPTAE